MYTLFELPLETEPVLRSIRAHTEALVSTSAARRNGQRIRASSNLLLTESPDEVFVLTEGCASILYNDQLLCILEEGDLIPQLSSSVGKFLTVRSEFAVLVDVYDKAALLRACPAEYVALLEAQLSVLAVCVGIHLKGESAYAPTIKNFTTGTPIVIEGAHGDEVYTLAEGAADVFVGGVKVGEIGPDQIFGAIAALGATPRTATVVATRDCLVLALPKARFLDLIKLRPATIEKLVQDMAKTITSLNSLVVSLKSASTAQG